jgi:predicted DNA-binding transcriptional regulator AlpA
MTKILDDKQNGRPRDGDPSAVTESEPASEMATLVDVVRRLDRIAALIAENGSELLRADDAARLCGVSRATWDRLRAAGQVPAPVHLGNSLMWSRKTLLAWIADGCGKPD